MIKIILNNINFINKNNLMFSQDFMCFKNVRFYSTKVDPRIIEIIQSIKDTENFKIAFNHKSLLNTDPNIKTYEELANSGDKYLNILIDNFIKKSYPNITEKDFNNIKNSLINDKVLKEISTSTGLIKFIKIRGKKTGPVLVATFKSFLAALYLEKGFAILFEFLLLTIFINSELLDNLEKFNINEISLIDLPASQGQGGGGIDKKNNSLSLLKTTPNRISEIIGSVKDTKRFQIALTHRSFLQLDPNASTYEIFEFLGNSLLESCVTFLIYNFYPDYNEGQLTNLRSSLVNNNNLSSICLKIGLFNYIRLGKENVDFTSNNLNKKDIKILADVYESFLTIIYLEKGKNILLEFIILTIFDKPEFQDLIKKIDKENILNNLILNDTKNNSIETNYKQINPLNLTLNLENIIKKIEENDSKVSKDINNLNKSIEKFQDVNLINFNKFIENLNKILSTKAEQNLPPAQQNLPPAQQEEIIVNKRQSFIGPVMIESSIKALQEKSNISPKVENETKLSPVSFQDATGEINKTKVFVINVVKFILIFYVLLWIFMSFNNDFITDSNQLPINNEILESIKPFSIELPQEFDEQEEFNNELYEEYINNNLDEKIEVPLEAPQKNTSKNGFILSLFKSLLGPLFLYIADIIYNLIANLINSLEFNGDLNGEFIEISERSMDIPNLLNNIYEILSTMGSYILIGLGRLWEMITNLFSKNNNSSNANDEDIDVYLDDNNSEDDNLDDFLSIKSNELLIQDDQPLAPEDQLITYINTQTETEELYEVIEQASQTEYSKDNIEEMENHLINLDEAYNAQRNVINQLSLSNDIIKEENDELKEDINNLTNELENTKILLNEVEDLKKENSLLKDEISSLGSSNLNLSNMLNDSNRELESKDKELENKKEKFDKLKDKYINQKKRNLEYKNSMTEGLRDIREKSDSIKNNINSAEEILHDMRENDKLYFDLKTITEKVEKEHKEFIKDRDLKIDEIKQRYNNKEISHKQCLQLMKEVYDIDFDWSEHDEANNRVKTILENQKALDELPNMDPNDSVFTSDLM